jgi:DNA-binding transcriptional MerR regulator
MVDCLYSTAVNEQRRHQATPDAEPGYLRIGQLAKRTGVSPELLRAWEQRYGLLQPTRTAGGFRLYSAADEARVQGMQSLVSGGLAAAQAARLILSDAEPAPPTPSASATTLEEAAGNLTASLDRLDEQAANTALDRLFATSPSRRSCVTPSFRTYTGWGNDRRPARSRSPRNTSPPTCSEDACSALPKAGAKAKVQPPRSPAYRANSTNSACWRSGLPCAAAAGGSSTWAPTARSAPSPTSPNPSHPRSWSC